MTYVACFIFSISAKFLLHRFKNLLITIDRLVSDLFIDLAVMGLVKRRCFVTGCNGLEGQGGKGYLFGFGGQAGWRARFVFLQGITQSLNWHRFSMSNPGCSEII